METKIFRGNTKGMVAFSSMISIVLIGFSIYSFYVFTIEPMPIGVCIFITILIAAFLLIPGILYFLGSLYSYWKRIQIFEDKLVLICPFKKRKIIRMEELSFWGCVAYAPKSTMFFFCTSDQPMILQYLNAHWSLCERVFGKHRIHRLEHSDEGIIRLAVGTYLYRCLFYQRQDVFFLNYGTAERLKALVNLFKRDALITGPWLIDTASAWEVYSKYRP